MLLVGGTWAPRSCRCPRRASPAALAALCIRPPRLLGGVTSIHREIMPAPSAPCSLSASCESKVRKASRRRLGRANGPAHRGIAIPFLTAYVMGSVIIDAFLPWPCRRRSRLPHPGAAVVRLGLKATGVAQQWGFAGAALLTFALVSSRAPSSTPRVSPVRPRRHGRRAPRHIHVHASGAGARGSPRAFPRTAADP